MKKYCYNMGWGLNEYSLNEIAFDLGVDASYLQKLLNENNDDIANCIGKAIADKKQKELFKSIIDVYSTDYLSDKSLKDICNNEVMISMDKDSFIKELNIGLEESMNDYILLNEDALNLLLVNTHYDLGKPAYSDLDLDYINFLRGIADGRYLENNLAAINDNDPLLKDKLEIISDSSINNELTLSKDRVRNLLQVVSCHRLPMLENEKITNSLKGKSCIDFNTYSKESKKLCKTMK